MKRDGLKRAMGMAVLTVTTFLGAIGGGPAGAQGAGVAWNSSYAAAQKTASRDGKPLLLDFGATWCGPCKEMLRTTYKDSTVAARAKAFVPVLVDVDKSPDLAKKYNVDALPVVLLLSPKGKVIGRATGFQTVPQLLKLMEQAGKKAH